MPIGRPWQTIAADILEVPLSTNNNRYLLVVQDYFTKWTEAIPLPDQTAARITGELIKLFSVYGHPKISTRTRVATSRVPFSRKHWRLLAFINSEPWHITRKVMVQLNVSTGLFCNYYEPVLTNRMTGNATCHLCCMRTALPSTHLPGLHLFS